MISLNTIPNFLITFFIISIYSFINFDYKSKNVLYIIFGIILILIAGFRTGVRDYINYVIFYNMLSDPFIGYFVEPSFRIIATIVKSTIDNVVLLFVIYAIIGVFLKLKAIKELSLLWGFSLLIYLGNLFIRHEMTQIRAGVATGFFLLCIKPLYEKDIKRFLLFTALATFFHTSSLIILPLWIFNEKKINKLFYSLSIPVAYFLNIFTLGYISKILSLIPLEPIRKIAFYLKGSEGNIFNIFFLVKCGIFYYLLWNCNLLSKNNKYSILLIKIFWLSLVSFAIFIRNDTISRRITDFYGVVEIILFPMIIYTMRYQIIAKLIVVLVALAFLWLSIFYLKLATPMDSTISI